MTIDEIIGRLTELRSSNAFNPYAERCAVADLPEAPEIRRHNLKLILKAAADRGIDEVWLALEPTYRGARRTGLAMTDERHLQAHGRRFEVDGLRRATIPPDPAEETAGIVWSALEGIERRVFLWNTVPLHTHRAGEPFSLRRHNAAERAASKPILDGILELLTPGRLVAVGYEASQALHREKKDHEQVRHPARNGAKRFTEQVSDR